MTDDPSQWTLADIEPLVEAFIACELHDPSKRRLLFQGVDGKFEAGLLRHGSPIDQLRTDLGQLARPLHDGRLPIIQYLSNACVQASARPEVAVIAGFLNRAERHAAPKVAELPKPAESFALLAGFGTMTAVLRAVMEAERASVVVFEELRAGDREAGMATATHMLVGLDGRALADERFVSFVARVTARARVEPNLLTVVFREVVRLDGTPLATVRFARWPGGGGLNELGNPLDQVAEIGRRVARRVRPEPVGAA